MFVMFVNTDIPCRPKSWITLGTSWTITLDSYRVLHGRATFEGFREHAVIWLTSDEFSKELD
jgi:hypothetical protein